MQTSAATMYRLRARLAAYARQRANAIRPYLFRLSLRCTCSWLPADDAVLDLLIAATSFVLALLTDFCLWLYFMLSGVGATMNNAGVIYVITPLFGYALWATALSSAQHGVRSMRLYRLDCGRRLFALGFDIESGDPVGDKLTRACRLLACSESHDDVESPAGSMGVPFEPSNGEWYQILTGPVRWSGTVSRDHVLSFYTMRITKIEHIGPSGTELVRFKGTCVDLTNSFICAGYACHRGGRICLSWGHAYGESGDVGPHFAFGDGGDGRSREQCGVVTLDKDNNIALTGSWRIDSIRPSYVSSGSLLSGTLALVARYS